MPKYMFHALEDPCQLIFSGLFYLSLSCSHTTLLWSLRPSTWTMLSHCRGLKCLALLSIRLDSHRLPVLWSCWWTFTWTNQNTELWNIRCYCSWTPSFTDGEIGHRFTWEHAASWWCSQNKNPGFLPPNTRSEVLVLHFAKHCIHGSPAPGIRPAANMQRPQTGPGNHSSQANGDPVCNW